MNIPSSGRFSSNDTWVITTQKRTETSRCIFATVIEKARQQPNSKDFNETDKKDFENVYRDRRRGYLVAFYENIKLSITAILAGIVDDPISQTRARVH
jgi:hypothetical protein